MSEHRYFECDLCHERIDGEQSWIEIRSAPPQEMPAIIRLDLCWPCLGKIRERLPEVDFQAFEVPF